MTEKIKGITVTIGGDTTGLNKALAGTNKEIGTTQGELKKVERLLKLDPTNTVLLEQKQQLLAKAIAGTGDKLSALKQAEKQVQEQFKAGKIGEEQYRSFRREVIGMEQNLKSLEAQAAKSNAAVAGITGTADSISKSAGRVASSMAPVTAGIVGAGVAAVMAMDQVDEGLDMVMTKTGATGQQAQELETVYNNVARVVPGSFEDIGAAVGEVNTRLDLTGDALEAASIRFLQFAKINGTDVNTSIQLVSRAMGDAGIESSRYGEVLDALTVAGQKSGISIDTLAGNLAKYGAPMRALGIDTQQAIAMFAGWEKAGVNTEIAFSGMKKAISTWAASGKDSREEFEKTLASIAAAPDIASATSMAIAVFGAKAGPDMADAIKGGRFEVEAYVAALENAGGAVQNTYGMIVDEVDDTALAAQTAQLALHDIGETVSKAIGPVLLDMANALDAVTRAFANLDSGVQTAVLTAVGLVAAIAPVMSVIDVIAGGISKLDGAITWLATNGVKAATAGIKVLGDAFTWISSTGAKLFTEAIKGIGVAMNWLAANPVVLIVAAIVAVVAAIIYLWNTNEDFKKGIIGIWKAIQSMFAGVGQFIVSIFTEKIPAAFNFLLDLARAIGNVLAAIIKAPINMAISLINFFINTVNDAITWLNNLKLPDFLGGASLGINIEMLPTLPMLANGGSFVSGSAIVGDAGPEMLTLMGGRATVTPLTASSGNGMAALKMGNTYVNNTISIDAGKLSDVNRLLNIMDGERRSRRQGYIGR